MRTPRKTRPGNRRGRTRNNPGLQSSQWPADWLMGITLILVFTVAAILHVRSRHAVVHLGYRLSDAVYEHERLMADYRKLQVEVATLRNPRRLRQLAAGPLGLMEPSASQIVHLSSNAQGKLAMGDR